LKRALQIRSRLEDAPGSAFTRHNLEMLEPPSGPGPQSGEPRIPAPPAPPKRRINVLALFLIVFPAFILGTLTGAYYGCRLEIAPVISALASALQVDSERAAVAFLEATPTTMAAAGDAPAPAMLVEASPSPTLTLVPSETPTLEPTQTHTAAPTDTATPQPPTPTETTLPSDTPSPTPETAANSLPLATVLQQATCRYGPGSAYLYADGLYPQDAVIINGRNYSASWLYVQNIKNDRYCWISASLLQTSADLKTIQVWQSTLPHTSEVSQPTGVLAVRNKDTITITWDQVHVNLVDARGYLLELTICQNGLRFPVVVQTDATSYEIQDEAACAGESSGLIYSVNTRGYTTPVKVTWPD
jgi:hypothetical protein